jgi:pimeloyl-ACP methyl ester carboxylesterase
MLPGPRAVPTFFGSTARPCFGWFHLPASAGARDLGVVLCKPFGYEAMCAHRALRELAEKLCASGFPVLRFDQYATGDSAGAPQEEKLVSSWLETIPAAAEALRKASGATRISLFGLRLGGTLAMAAAANAPVESLVLWAPFRTGKSFVREARAFQDLKGAIAGAPDAVPAGLEVAGFPLSADSIEALNAIDLHAIKTAPAKRVLLLGRDDLPENQKLDEQLKQLGAEVERSQAPGYQAMLRDANESKVPAQAIDAIVAHLTSLAQPGSLQPAPAPQTANALIQLSDAAVIEEPLQFGEGGRLFGILTRPAAPSAVARPIALFLNVGSNHHVGPNRMYVVQARALAARGVASFRFDVSGLGDSAPAPGMQGNRLYSPEAIADARAAIDLAAARMGARKAALIGLCSGAFLAFHTANADERVAGQALLNQQTFHWREGDSLALAVRRSVKASSFYKKALFEAETWKRMLAGQIHLGVIAGSFLRRFSNLIASQGKAAKSFASGRGWDGSEVAGHFRRALARGTQVLLVFSDADGGIDVMEEHLGTGARKIKRRTGFRLEIIPGPDHTFTPVWSQRRLEALFIEWIERLPG